MQQIKNLDAKTKTDLVKWLTMIISETNGISLKETLNLLISSDLNGENKHALALIIEFKELLEEFVTNKVSINILLNHPFSECVFEFFKAFPIKYYEEHIHLTGSLTGSTISPRTAVKLLGFRRDLPTWTSSPA
ncbi:MAG: hypothetical protein EOP04_13020, partial [Proteobacteria bacterium]